MKYEITEKQLEKLKKVIQGFIDSALDSLRKMSEDWGLGQMDEYDEVRSVEKIVVDRIVPYTGINVYIDMYVKNDRDYNNFYNFLLRDEISSWRFLFFNLFI
jgi:hypothetical protein